MSILQSTFLHVPGIGAVTERRLWQAGICTWQDYLDADTPGFLSAEQQTMLAQIVPESVHRLEAEDYAWFAKRLVSADHWRAAGSFQHRMACLDIETDGGRDADSITLIGIYDGKNLQQFVRGDNLHEFPSAIADCALLVTFFGTGFDLPMIRQTFRGLAFNQLHVDLCYLLRGLGYRGGLKKIEKQLGLSRAENTDGLSGLDAVRLWQEYQRGSSKSLRTLLEYNGEDVINLQTLLQIGCSKMAHTLQLPAD